MTPFRRGGALSLALRGEIFPGMGKTKVGALHGIIHTFGVDF